MFNRGRKRTLWASNLSGEQAEKGEMQSQVRPGDFKAERTPSGQIKSRMILVMDKAGKHTTAHVWVKPCSTKPPPPLFSIRSSSYSLEASQQCQLCELRFSCESETLTRLSSRRRRHRHYQFGESLVQWTIVHYILCTSYELKFL
jgi:hypothetical protein